MQQDELSERLKSALESADLNASELAERLGVARSYVSHWTSGRRTPSEEQLGEIAAALQVDSGWLRGETAATATPQLDSAWAWRDVPPDGGRDYGNPNVFATPAGIATLDKEATQNSVDFPVQPHGQQMHLRYTLIELTEGTEAYRNFMKASGFDELRRHLRASTENTSKLGSRLRAGLDRLEEEGRLVCLRIDDYAATGLYGAEKSSGSGDERDPNPFAALVRNNLDSTKQTTTAGGSYGVGKAVLWRSSDLSSVLFASEIVSSKLLPNQPEDRFRLCGKAELPWHEIETGEACAGPGWLGEVDTAGDSIWVDGSQLKALQMDRTQLPPGLAANRTSGTSILILGFRDPKNPDPVDLDDAAKALAEAAAINSWPLMVDGRLKVWLQTSKDGVLSTHQEVKPEDYVPELVDMYQKHRDNEVTTDLAQPGDVKRFEISLTVLPTLPDARGLKRYDDEIEASARLLIRLAEPDSQSDQLNTVALVRGRGMVVEYKAQRNIVVGGQAFHALVLAGEASEIGDSETREAAEQFLRAAEPPAHDKWELTDELRDNYQRGTGARLEDFFGEITKQLKEAIRPPESGEEEGPRELRRLLKVGSEPSSAPAATIRKSEAIVEQGVWMIEGEIHINDKTRAWRITPRLWLDVESGQAIRLAWESLTSGRTGVTVEEDTLITRPNVRRLDFTGTSAKSADGIAAAQCRLKLDLRIDRVEDEED